MKTAIGVYYDDTYVRRNGKWLQEKSEAGEMIRRMVADRYLSHPLDGTTGS